MLLAPSRPAGMRYGGCGRIWNRPEAVLSRVELLAEKVVVAPRQVPGPKRQPGRVAVVGRWAWRGCSPQGCELQTGCAQGSTARHRTPDTFLPAISALPTSGGVGSDTIGAAASGVSAPGDLFRPWRDVAVPEYATRTDRPCPGRKDAAVGHGRSGWRTRRPSELEGDDGVLPTER